MFGFYETPTCLDAKIKGVCPPLCALVESGTVELHWQLPTADLLDAYAERMLETVHSRKIKRLFIDGLGALREAAGAEAARMGKFVTALMNELQVLGITTFYTLEVSGVMGPNFRSPIANLSSLGENLILLRFVEQGARLHRLISVTKVMDSEFDSSLYKSATSSRGLLIAETPDSADKVMAGYARFLQEALFGDGQPRERHGR